MIKVYKMNDIDWVVSPLSVEETNNWYIDATECDAEDQTIDMVKECDLHTDGMWWMIEDENQLIELDNKSDEDENFEEIRAESGKTTFGDVIRHEGMWCEYVPFREVINRLNYKNITMPDFIATTEW